MPLCNNCVCLISRGEGWQVDDLIIRIGSHWYYICYFWLLVRYPPLPALWLFPFCWNFCVCEFSCEGTWVTQSLGPSFSKKVTVRGVSPSIWSPDRVSSLFLDWDLAPLLEELLLPRRVVRSKIWSFSKSNRSLLYFDCLVTFRFFCAFSISFFIAHSVLGIPHPLSSSLDFLHFPQSVHLIQQAAVSPPPQ